MIFMIAILAIAAILVFTNVSIVSQAQCYVIERLGQYRGTWQAGLHVKLPFFDRVASRISLKEQVLDFPPQAVITKDNVTMQIDSVVYARVFDAKKYTYGVENPVVGLQNLTSTTLRSIIGDMELDATLSSRTEINDRMQMILDEATDEWGLKVTRVEIKNIQPPKEIEDVMTKQMKAERERRQTVLEAQAHQEAVVSRAKGDREATLMNAEAQRDAQIALAEGQAQAVAKLYIAEADGIALLANAGLSEGILRLKSIEAMKDVADGQATKIFIPNNLSDSLAGVGVIGDMLQTKQMDAQPRATMRKSAVMQQAHQQLQADTCLNESRNEQTQGAALQNAVSTSAMSGKAKRQLRP